MNSEELSRGLSSQKQVAMLFRCRNPAMGETCFNADGSRDSQSDRYLFHLAKIPLFCRTSNDAPAVDEKAERRTKSPTFTASELRKFVAYFFPVAFVPQRCVPGWYVPGIATVRRKSYFPVS